MSEIRFMLLLAAILAAGGMAAGDGQAVGALGLGVATALVIFVIVMKATGNA